MDEVEKVCAWIKDHAPANASLYIDSRSIGAGDVFFAVKGLHTDARKYLNAVSRKGAACAVVEREEPQNEPCMAQSVGAQSVLSNASQRVSQCASPDTPQSATIPMYEVKDLYRKCGAIASAYYGNPSAAMYGCAVTGTNGKTTVANWIRALFNALNVPCGCIGTLGALSAHAPLPSVSMTTPDPVTVQRLFAQLRRDGCQAFSIEASSIGLEQDRLRGAAFKVGIFTNLTRDHLDYHGDMAHYGKAKEMLFAWPSLEYAVIQGQDPYAARIEAAAREHGKSVVTVGVCDDRRFDISASNVAHTREGLSFDVTMRDKTYRLDTHLIGTFNVENVLCAIAPAILYGFEPSRVLRQAARLIPPAGRMQTVRGDDGLLGVVDYSHTPDAIEKAIAAVRELARARGGKVWIVVGAGGDRDSGKRPLMGKAACAADEVVFTSDNPRSEDPLGILEQVQSGASKPCMVIEDRQKAIEYAVEKAGEHDVILTAGKGHEDYQEIKGVKHRFSDVEQLRNAMKRLRTSHE